MPLREIALFDPMKKKTPEMKRCVLILQTLRRTLPLGYTVTVSSE